MEMKKILVIGIILLFIGVAVAPCINQSVVKASQDDDLVEVTTQACGIKGYKDTTVKLTKEQYQNLEQYLVEFRARLNQTSTREEAAPIFKEAVVELDRYGLLPRGMSVGTAQRFVLGLNQNSVERLLSNRQKEIFPNCINVFCLLFMTATRDSSPDSVSLLITRSLVFLTAVALALIYAEYGVGRLLIGLLVSELLLSLLNPFNFLNLVFIIGYTTKCYSFGLKGFVGDTSYGPTLIGYSGLILFPFSEKVYFMGSSLALTN
jgi:hypothetical protein